MSDLIEKLSDLRSQYNCFDENEHETYHTLSEAIKVLSEQPNDAVSRADVLESFADLYETFEDCSKEIINELHRKFEDLRMLPSVTPKPDHSGDTTEMVEHDDCISRQAVADVAYEVGNLFDGEDDTRTPYGVAFDIQMAVDKLPSVTPKRKTGKWIHSDFSHEFLHCSECGRGRHFCSNFCPNCGADMRQREENK